MLPYLLLVFCAQEAPPAIPDPHAVGRGNPALDVLHYELRLRLDPRRRFIEGTATLEFDLLNEVKLDFPPEKILFDPDRILPWIPSS